MAVSTPIRWRVHAAVLGVLLLPALGFTAATLLNRGETHEDGLSGLATMGFAMISAAAWLEAAVVSTAWFAFARRRGGMAVALGYIVGVSLALLGAKQWFLG